MTTRYVWGAGGQDLYARIDVGVGLRQVSQDGLTQLGKLPQPWRPYGRKLVRWPRVAIQRFVDGLAGDGPPDAA